MKGEKEMITTDILLTILTLVTGVLAILTFFNGRKKENRQDGEKVGNLRADLQYIKEVLIDVRTETKEINKLLDDHSSRLAHCEEKLKSAFARIERIEKHIDER